jgi:PD-(D/E)XK nuclease superfamily
MKYTIEATIPATQYGNIRPSFVIEADGEEEVAMTKLHELWDRYGEKPLPNAGGEKVTTFTGEVIIYNDDLHLYTDLAGNKLKSGSAYADEGSKPFDKEMVLPRTSKAWGVDEQELGDIWDINSRISNEFGSAVHSAMELFIKHHAIGSKIAEKREMGANYAITRIPYLSSIVEAFRGQYGDDIVGAVPEVLISDVKNLMAGRVDFLRIIDKDKKVCRIGDYKTNAELDKKKLEKYQRQLSFYAKIMQNQGWKVTGLDIYHLADGWTKHELEIVNIDDEVAG